MCDTSYVTATGLGPRHDVMGTRQVWSLSSQTSIPMNASRPRGLEYHVKD